MYADPGFVLVAAALADISSSVPTAPAESKPDTDGGVQGAISALFAAKDPEPEAVAGPEETASGDMGQDTISALFASSDPEPETVAEPEAPDSGDMGQGAISALFGNDDPAADPVATSDAIETNTYDSVEEDLANTDMPEVTMVQPSLGEVEPGLSNFDDFDAEDDIDVDLIESILEGKDENPSA
jgi:hypothetical protein